jgi:hypothetical protein
MPKKRSEKQQKENANDGIIDPGRLYNFAAFKRITGLGTAALRDARRKGLAVRYYGRQGYILGEDAIAFIQISGTPERSGGSHDVA